MKTCVFYARPAALSLALAAALPALCQTEKSSELVQTVVTASRVATPVTDVIADVSIIDRETLDRAGQSSLRDILAQQPGVQMGSNGSYRSNSSIFLRGASNSQTIVLIDGVRVGSATSGGASFENLPLARIERIEILRGAASALYGPDAVGGVIQIFTREPADGLALSASAGFGSDGQRQLDASVRGSTGAIGYSLGVSREKARGISSVSSPLSPSFNPDADGFSSTSVDAKLTAKINREHALTLSLLQSDTEYQFDGLPSPNPLALTRLTSDARAKPKLNNATFKWEAQWLPQWKSTLTAGTSDEESVNEYYRISDRRFGGASRFNTQRRQLTWQNDFTLGKDVLSVLFEDRSEAVESSTNYTVKQRDLRSALVSYAFNRERWNALAVIRNDKNSQFGSFNNWALAAGYRLTDGLRAVGSVGTSFQAPTFNQLYFPGFGNAALVPQRNRATEVGLKYQQGNLALGAVAYHNDIQGFIIPSTNVQSSLAVLRGVTLTADVQSGTTSYALSYDYADPRSYSSVPASNGLRLVRIAQHVLNARVTHRMGDVSVFGELRLSGNREDAKVVGAGRDTLPGHSVLNTGVTWKVQKDVTLLGRINNLTDTRYMLANGFSVPGRNFFASVSWAM
ncbi:MAG: TonB-dependent receptor [Polaromonas sp.]|uniref:TonB-dependent receptor domain-containing protein n=1 Tax=Polaromonas sp. TaxID=1869339 RepID=UPI0017F074E4|nr:TonB-dependent receptor [Polaromonas sp.]MBA3593612.1 TonB-dependent receptor [Polaromonas sp.]